jgi:hypothetical protein
LGVGFVDGLALAQAPVELAGHFHGAFIHADATSGALIDIHIARLLANLCPKVAFLATDAIQFTTGE